MSRRGTRAGVCLAAVLACHASASGQDLYTLIGDLPGFNLGQTIERMPDLNNDGIDDFVLVGQGPHLPTGTPFPVNVCSGVDGSVLHFYTVIGGISSWEGLVVGSVGDLSGDGVPDYGVGDPNWGAAHFRSGADSSFLFSINQSGGQFGSDIEGLGDVDGDTVPDVVVAQPGSYIPTEGDPTFDGQVHVFSGATGAVIYTFLGGPGEDSFGRAVATPDVDGDGTKDIVIGVPENGRVEVHSGATGNLLYSVTRPANTLIGAALEPLPDIDGDDCEDFAAGAPGPSTTQRPGRIFVYSGRTGQRIFTLNGELPRDRFGWRVSHVGDVNGDGFPELLGGTFTAMVATPPRLFSLRDGSLLYDVDRGCVNCGPNTFGMEVSGIGDLNQDGLADFLVSDPFSNNGFGSVHARPGDDVFLNPVPRTVPAGQSLQLSLGSATAGAASLMVLLEIDGVPCPCPVLDRGVIAADGFRRLSSIPDPSLAGMSFTLQGFVLTPGGELLDSGRETVRVP